MNCRERIIQNGENITTHHHPLYRSLLVGMMHLLCNLAELIVVEDHTIKEPAGANMGICQCPPAFNTIFLTTSILSRANFNKFNLESIF